MDEGFHRLANKVRARRQRASASLGGAEARTDLDALRGAEAPLFHGCAGRDSRFLRSTVADPPAAVGMTI